MRTITSICIHHSGGLGNNYNAMTQHLNAQDIDNAHKERWGMKSSLGYFGGYNFFIDKNGKYTQFRAIGEETMAQVGHNFDSVSICLAGNFTKGVDTPTPAQIETLKFIMFSLLEKKHTFSVFEDTVLDIPWRNVYPHRVLQPNHTECFGNSLPDDWGKKFVIEYLSKKIQVSKTLVEAFITLLSLFQQRAKMELGSTDDKSCCY